MIIVADASVLHPHPLTPSPIEGEGEPDSLAPSILLE
jgi:hypothetical protein